MSFDELDLIDPQDLYNKARDSLIKLPPPITLLQTLDFNVLSNEYVFELFIYKFAHCIWPENEWEFFLFGKRGVAQYGIDILGLHRKGVENPIVLQVKKYSNFRKEEVIKSLAKFLEHDWSAPVNIKGKNYTSKQPQAYYLCMACKIDDTDFQKACVDFFQKFNSKGTKLYLYDQVKISNKLKEDVGESGKKLIHQFFGEAYFKAFYGEEPSFFIKRTREDLERALKPITKKTLQQAQKDAQDRLTKLEDIKSSKVGEYLKLCNEDALIGHLPEWRHIYMDDYGAFSRPIKEEMVLGEINKNIQKLTSKNNGLLLHIISGDSGCGKSTLIKLIIRRLIENQIPQKFSHILEAISRLQIFEILHIKDWKLLEHALLEFIQPDKDKRPLYLIYFDDLFALQEQDVDRILGIFNKFSYRNQIYFLTTSPSWIFDQNAIYNKKREFQLVASDNTIIEGLDDDDRKSLESQYRKMYGENYRQDLIDLIYSEKESLILLKLALHQNLNYSHYLQQLFKNLAVHKPRHLAALILFSTLSRFYVHFPLTLVQELNNELKPSERLWLEGGDYEDINYQGLKLFRVRYGNRSVANPSGLPDTIAPFHDRVAQVIYDTWGEKQPLPLFNRELWELRNEIYSKLNGSVQTRPILANVFRGHLKVASNNELTHFVDRFGPIQKNEWTLLDEPTATYRWITYSEYNLDRTKGFRASWDKVLNRIVTNPEKITQASLAILLLKKYVVSPQSGQSWVEGVAKLNEHSFPILQTILGILINQQQFRLLSKFLYQLNKWLDKYSSVDQASFYRYFVLSSLTNMRSRNIWTDKPLHDAIANIVKGYLKNINSEYATNNIIAWIKRNEQIHWQISDVQELSKILFEYINAGESRFLPILFEQFLHFVRLGSIEEFSTEQILNLYWKICIQNQGFYGLTYTSSELFEYLKWIKQKNYSQFQQIVNKVFDDLTTGKLSWFMENTAYPDFLSRFIKSLSILKIEVKAEQLLNLLRPLVANFYDPQPSKYVFGEIKNLKCPDIDLIFHKERDNFDKQIRLCMAKELKLPLEIILKDFTELLEKGELTLPTRICISVTEYLKTKKRNEISETSLNNYRERICCWLRENQEKKEAELVLPLVTVDILFSEKYLKGIEMVAQNAINHGFVPFLYLNWWLKEEVLHVVPEQRHPLLNAFWIYSLEHSNEKLQEDEDYIIYKKYFLYLLDKYPITQDMTWWVQAVRKLLEFYNQLVIRSFKPRTMNVKWERIEDPHMMYHQRLCMDKMMEVILRSSSLKDESLLSNFAKEIMELLCQYKNQLWAIRWLTKLNPEAEFDGTQLFLEYLSSIEKHPQKIQSGYIFSQFNWWSEWLKVSKKEILDEFKRVWEWIDKTVPPNISIFLIPAFFKNSPEIMRHFKCGNLIKNMVGNKTGFDFDNKSKLISSYLKWLETNENHKVDIQTLNEILTESIKTLAEHIDTRFAVYGFQDILQAAIRYKLDFESVKIEDIFLKITERTIELEEGGKIAMHYFTWLFSRKEKIDILKYLQWIETHYRKSQTPYVLMYFIQCLASNRDIHPPTINEIEQLWGTTKIFISNRLEHEGTRITSQIFMDYLVVLQDVLPINKSKLDKISEEFYQLCLQQSGHAEIIYLLTSFSPFWRKLVDQPSSGEILRLWGNLFPLNDKYVEVFGNLTRQLDDYIQQGNEESLSPIFYTILADFIENNPGHLLSPKFAKMLIPIKSYLSKVSRLLPNLIRRQINLEELTYVLIEYFLCIPKNLGENDRVEYETSIFEALEENLHKPFSEVCVYSTINGCTPNVHYTRLIKLMESYLSMGRGSEKDFWMPIQAYHDYESKCGVEKSFKKERLGKFLLIIRDNAQTEQSYRYFSSILRTWESDLIPLELTVDTLRFLILQVQPARSTRIKEICKHFKNLFGADILLSSTVSIKTILEQIQEHGEAGLIFIRRELQKEIIPEKRV